MAESFRVYAHSSQDHSMQSAISLSPSSWVRCDLTDQEMRTVVHTFCEAYLLSVDSIIKAVSPRRDNGSLSRRSVPQSFASEVAFGAACEEVEVHPGDSSKQ